MANCPHCQNTKSSRLQEYPTFHLKLCDNKSCNKTFVENVLKIGKGTKIWQPENILGGNIEIGENCSIGRNGEINGTGPGGVKIGNNVRIAFGVFIPDGITIEDDVFVAMGVCFTNDKNPPSGKANWLPTRVRQGAMIGANATILPGLTIGKNAKVGAGSVVTKDVPDGVVVCGNPAVVHNKNK